MNISVKNFRIFEKTQNFEIRPLTLIVGPNNTGKSALSKLLQLLKYGTFKLDFENSGLNSFEDVVNWNHPTHGFKFSYPAYNVYLPHLEVTVNYNDGVCKSLELTADDENSLIKVVEINKNENNNYFLNFNYRWLMDCIFDDYLYYKNTLLNSKQYNINIDEFRPLPNLESINSFAYKDIEKTYKEQLSYLYDKDERLKKYSQHYGHVYDKKFYAILPLFTLIDEIKQNNNQKSYSLFNVFDQFKDVTELYESKIIDIQDQVFSSIKINLKDEFIDGETISTLVKEEIINKFLKCTSGLDLIIEENRIFKLIFEHKMLQVNYETKENQYTLFSELINQLFFLRDNLKRLHHSNVTRDISKEYVSNLNNILENLKNGRKNHYLNIIREILEKFDLKDIEIDKTVIWITDENDRKIDIRNLGYGYSKLVPLILGLIELSIVDIYSLYNDFFIIEEPESNLHPDFQSKLAEVFTIISQYFLSANLIVETHSEYLIRNLQYLIATKQATKNSSVIYYFNKDKYVSRNNPKVTKITINSNGHLSCGFGKGFFDEAIKLQFKLSQLPYNNN